jgi:hypothetical protein
VTLFPRLGYLDEFESSIVPVFDPPVVLVGIQPALGVIVIPDEEEGSSLGLTVHELHDKAMAIAEVVLLNVGNPSLAVFGARNGLDFSGHARLGDCRSYRLHNFLLPLLLKSPEVSIERFCVDYFEVHGSVVTAMIVNVPYYFTDSVRGAGSGAAEESGIAVPSIHAVDAYVLYEGLAACSATVQMSD